jgi:hypothetical protein
LGLAEIVGALGHFVKHCTDLLPLRVEFFELRRRDVARIERVVYQDWVSVASPNASLSLLTNAASYRRLAHASAIIAFTAREERRI